MNFSIFNEFAFTNLLLDRVDRRKVVMDTILLSLPRLSGGMRHGKSKLLIGKPFHEHLNQGTLANAGGTTKYNRTNVKERFCCRCHGPLLSWWGFFCWVVLGDCDFLLVRNDQDPDKLMQWAGDSDFRAVGQ